MNYCVPDFEMDEDYSIPTSSVPTWPKKSPIAEEEIMELLWQNGQVVMQSQNQRSVKRSHVGDAAIPAERREIRSLQEESTTDHLFMQEDEMTSWLHYPMDYSSFDRGDLYSDLIYPAPCAPVDPSPRTAKAKDVLISPPTAAYSLPPPRSSDAEYSERIQNFVHFSRPKARIERGTSSSNMENRNPTVVDSCETPVESAPESMASHVVGITVQVPGANTGCGTDAEAGGRETAACEMTSSPVRSRASASPSVEPVHKSLLANEDRKRKGREADDSESPSEDVEFESPDAKKQIYGSPSAKKTRAAEVHNLSERRRRDRINEKMKALQELIPHCNKSDKASMLDEAIEYLKSLQLQVQMMSMGCSMVPVVFPGFQQYMPPMGMTMGMGTETGMSRPMMPFPSVLVGPAMPTPGAAAHMGPLFPVPAFHVPSFPGPYQQFIGLHHAQVPQPQNQATMQPSTSKPCSSREVENDENLQSGMLITLLFCLLDMETVKPSLSLYLVSHQHASIRQTESLPQT